MEMVEFFVFLVKEEETPPLYIIYQTDNAGGFVWCSAIERICRLVVEQKSNGTTKI
jgi:hypothetical protein